MNLNKISELKMNEFKMKIKKNYQFLFWLNTLHFP